MIVWTNSIAKKTGVASGGNKNEIKIVIPSTTANITNFIRAGKLMSGL